MRRRLEIFSENVLKKISRDENISFIKIEGIYLSWGGQRKNNISVNKYKKGQVIMSKKKYLGNARLPFHTRTVRAVGGMVEVYVIPDDKKAEVLEELYPFIPVPSLDEEMYDVHADKKFKVKDFCVTREGGMNFLVSPNYFESGGTVIDWIPADSED